MAKANRWVDFIRKWAKDNDTTYSCALSNPKCKADYRAKYGVRKAVPAKTERERMGLEDVNIKPIPKPKMSFKDKVEAYLATIKPVEKKKKLKIREDNEPIRVKKITIDGVVYLVDKATGTQFFDLDTQEQIEDPRKGAKAKPKSGGKKGLKAAWRSTKKGIQKGLDETAAVLNMTNPVYQMNTRAPEVGEVMGNLSYNYALPAMVSMGYYAYIEAAESAAVMMGLPPQVGKEAAEILWDEMVVKQGYDPRERQKSAVLGNVADRSGRLYFGGRSAYMYRL